MNRGRAVLIASLAAAVLAGCDLAPVYDPPHYVLPESYQGSGPFRAGATRRTSLSPRGDWWTLLGDQSLNELEEQLERFEPDPPGSSGSLHPGARPGSRGRVAALSASRCAGTSVGQSAIRTSSIQHQRHAETAGLQCHRGGGVVGAGFLACVSQQRACAEATRAGQRRRPRHGALEPRGGTRERLHRPAGPRR